MAKEAYFFSHDSNASQDPKILLMCSTYKAEGYGWYWMIIEKMREQENFKLPLSSEEYYKTYAIHCYAKLQKFKKFIQDSVEIYKLFEKDENFIWSPSLLRRMSLKVEKSIKAKKSAEQRWSHMQTHSDTNTNALEPHNENNANATQTQSDTDAIKERKVKESKLNIKEIKENENAYNIFVKYFGEPTPFEVEEIKDIEITYPKGWFADACEEMAKNKVCNLKYATKILENWFENGKNNGHKNIDNTPKDRAGW